MNPIYTYIGVSDKKHQKSSSYAGSPALFLYCIWVKLKINRYLYG
nr:MAG TPA: hypothetical protein [Caudoviricetes sp.]